MAKKSKAQESKAQESKAQESKAQEQVKSDEHLADAVRNAAEKIWLAGLGAFAKSRSGTSKSFETLVRAGELLQGRTHAVADESLHQIGSGYRGATGKGAGQPAPSCDWLEQVFEDRVARTLTRLGVPSASEIHELTVLLGALTDRIDMLDTMQTSLSSIEPTIATGSANADKGRAAKARKATRTA